MIKRIRYSLTLKPETIEALRKTSEKTGIPAARLVENQLKVLVDNYEKSKEAEKAGV